MPYMSYRSFWILAAILAGSVGAHAQWLKHPTPGTPRTKDGKPNLSAPAPRAADGKPDLSGLWIAESASIKELEKIIPDHVDGAQTLGEAAPSRYFMNILWDFKPEEIVMTPAAAALAKKRGATDLERSPLHTLPAFGRSHFGRGAVSSQDRPNSRTDSGALRRSDDVPADLHGWPKVAR